MNQQHSYPDGPGPTPQYGDDPVPTASYDLEPRPGYDPTGSMPVMGAHTPPQQQPGYGPPPPPGTAPPPGGMPPPEKSNTGLILGILIGVIVLVVVAGAGVWFFAFGGSGDDGQAGPGSADGKREVFPTSYTPTEAPPPDGENWKMSKPESYDKCVDLELTGIRSLMAFAGNPKGETIPEDENTGRVTCEGDLAGKTYDGAKPTGKFYVDFDAAKDATEAGEDYKAIWTDADGWEEAEKLDVGEEAERRVMREGTVIGVAIGYRIGNVSGLARISVDYGTDFKPPDVEMLANVLTDVIYSGLNGS